MPKTLYKLTLTPANLQVVYYFYTMQYYPNPSQKPYNFIFYCKYDPFTPNNYFALCNSTEYYSITLSFSYISLSGITTKTHFTPDFTKETLEKSRFDTSLYARALLLYDLLSSLLIRQNKTYLTSNSTPY
jgi:hypothetical protein